MELYVSGVLNIQPAALNATRKVPFPVIRENSSAFDFLVDPLAIYEYLRKDDTSLPDLPTPFSAKDLVALKERLGRNEYAALLISSPPSVLDQLWLQRPAILKKRREVRVVFRFFCIVHCHRYALLVHVTMHLSSLCITVVVYALRHCHRLCITPLSSFMHYSTVVVYALLHCRRLCITPLLSFMHYSVVDVYAFYIPPS